MSHGNAIVNGNSIELSSKASQFLNLLLHQLACLMQVHMTWYKLSKRVDDCNDGLSQLFLFHAVCHP